MRIILCGEAFFLEVEYRFNFRSGKTKQHILYKPTKYLIIKIDNGGITASLINITHSSTNDIETLNETYADLTILVSWENESDPSSVH